MASQKFQEIGHKNEDCSKSVNSFHSGAIFRPQLGQYLSGNVGLVFVYALLKKLYCRIGPAMRPTNDRNFRKSDVSEV